MYTAPISADELKQYWNALDAMTEGESMACIPLCYMPPWNDVCSQLNWQSYLLDGGYFSQKRFGYCGVYRLFALAAENDLSRPAKFNRVCGADTTGTLYIGEAGFLHERLNKLRRSMTSHSEHSHNAARMLRSIPVLKMPPEKLAVAVLFTGRSTRGVESDLLQAYMNTFGDTPPLNYKL